MNPFKIDVSVLVIFFARPEKFQQVFDEIRKARPSKLYLYQDGPRQGRADDIENIEKCREIAKNIDWDCTVHKMYQNENFGCDPSEYIAQKWMFATEEYGIVLEDDDVPSQSFFPFCKELLEKYKDDERIGIICGMNNLETVESDYSYFFSDSGSIWGWATWKRNIDNWDPNYSWIQDSEITNLLEYSMGIAEFKTFINTVKQHKATGKEHYETILGASIYLNNQVNIIPSKNLIANIGIGENGTHASANLDTIPKRIRKLLYMKTYELDFPLKHPEYVINNTDYKNKVNTILGNTSKFIKAKIRLEGVILQIKHGELDMKTILSKLKKIGRN